MVLNREQAKKEDVAKINAKVKTKKESVLARFKKGAKATKPEHPRRQTVVGVPTNNKIKLVNQNVMRSHNFLSSTNALLTEIYPLKPYKGEKARYNSYAAAAEPCCVSAILKLTLNIMETNELSQDWTLRLWNISQEDNLLPADCSVTFTRVFERRSNELVSKKVTHRKRLAILSSTNSENIKRQSKARGHDNDLLNAIESGDSVVSFGAEAIVTAPDEIKLEQAVEIVKNYLNSNDETRGLVYALDVGRQNRPFIVYGPDEPAGNKGVFTDCVSYDGGQSALFVDSGGDRSSGSEYIGVSVGKLIRSHAAYNFQNHVSLYVGNDTTNEITTLGRKMPGMTQIYLSKVASRAYLLDGKNVVHFVADSADSVKQLQDIPLNNDKKIVADASKGLLNIIECIDDGNAQHESKDRLLSRFPMHVNNIITLLSQFRSRGHEVDLSDNFANMARDILIDFFVANKYWSYNARRNPLDIRLFGYHERYRTLADFGQYVQERKSAHDAKNQEQRDALIELDTIINRNILPTIPALDTHTDPVIDQLVRTPYKIVDLTGMGTGVRSGVGNPAMNVMMLAYLNIILPTLNNGDVVFLHGISQMSSIAQIIKTMIATCGSNIDVVYTEKNQSNAVEMLGATSDMIERQDPTTDKLIKVPKMQSIDFVAIDLYHNSYDKLIDTFSMDADWSKQLSKIEASYFIKTNDGIDYIYLDNIL